MDVVRSSLYWENGEPEVQYNKAYTVRSWKYTQKGYFFFEEYYPGGYGEPSGQVALRIKPLDEKCREFNRKYCLSPGYGMNNLFLCDWNESDFGALNFYDIYENLAVKIKIIRDRADNAREVMAKKVRIFVVLLKNFDGLSDSVPVCL